MISETQSPSAPSSSTMWNCPAPLTTLLMLIDLSPVDKKIVSEPSLSIVGQRSPSSEASGPGAAT